MALNPDVTVEVQQSDSTTGMTSTIDGAYDIGMASRELRTASLKPVLPRLSSHRTVSLLSSTRKMR